MKYLVLFAVLFVVYTLWKQQRQRERDARGGQRPGAAARGPRQEPFTLEMVRCEVCSVHLPSADALTDGQGRWFCSAAHRDQAPR